MFCCDYAAQIEITFDFGAVSPLEVSTVGTNCFPEHRECLNLPTKSNI